MYIGYGDLIPNFKLFAPPSGVEREVVHLFIGKGFKLTFGFSFQFIHIWWTILLLDIGEVDFRYGRTIKNNLMIEYSK